MIFHRACCDAILVNAAGRRFTGDDPSGAAAAAEAEAWVVVDHAIAALFEAWPPRYQCPVVIKARANPRSVKMA